MERVPNVTQTLASRTGEFILFIIVLFAAVAGAQTAQYLQTTLGYKQPYFIFYIVHSCLLLSFPIHLVYLLKTKHGLQPLVTGLDLALAAQVTAWNADPSSSIGSFPMAKLLVLVICLTAFCNLPALLWYAAVPLAAVTEVTAIWNANAFFAYILSVKFLGAKWGVLRSFAVITATLGVLSVIYGGAPASSSNLQSAKINLPVAPARFIGDMLTLVASALYGLYQVLYKKYIALPSNPELTGTSGPGQYRLLPERVDNTLDGEAASVLCADDVVYPPPFGLHPNLITATIGLCTLLVFWIPIPLLHYYQIENFRLPPNGRTLLAIAGMTASGLVFNAGSMILLGVWGPIVTSVGSLLSIVLTSITDMYFGAVALTFGGMLGAGMIVCAFGILVYDMF